MKVMPSMNTAIPMHTRSLKLKSHFETQITLNSFLMALIIALLGYKSIPDLHKTIPFIILISFLGLFVITKFESKLNIGSLKIYGYIWILKVFLSVSVLFLGWVPDLDTVLITWTGFDPQRYYHQAVFLADSELKIFTIIGHHQYYVGIIYYYAVLMYFFGANPIAPVFINIFITLLTSLYIIRFLSFLDVDVEKYKNSLFFMLVLFPEILWYDVMTGRDTLSMCLVTLSVISFSTITLNQRKYIDYLILIFSMLLLSFIRTPITLLLIVAFLIMCILNFNIFKRNTIHLVSIFALFFLGITLNQYLGAAEFTFDRFTRAFVGQDTYAIYVWEWSDRSLGQLLIPKNMIETILFVIPRAIVYLVSPLPRVTFSINEMISGAWGSWHNFFGTLSALIYIFLMPYVLSAFFCYITNWNNYKQKYLLIVLPYYIIFTGLIASVNIIHDRYRVMVTMLFVVTAFLGFNSPKYVIFRSYIIWFVSLFFFALFYTLYKFT